MDAKKLQDYLYEHIPITKALGIVVLQADEQGVRLTAPLSNNINHRDTAFGGSVSSLLITACWGYLRILFDAEPSIPTIVVGRSGTDFMKPIHSDITAELILPSEKEVTHLRDMYERFGKGRITLRAAVQINSELCAYFDGDFVVFR